MKNKEIEEFKELDKQSRDLTGFQEKVLDKYRTGKADGLPADAWVARSLLPPMTATDRSFAMLSSELPFYSSDKCVACMECVIACPDAALVGKVNTQAEVDQATAALKTDAERKEFQSVFAKTQRHWTTNEKKGATPGYFSIWVDPDKCKACGECVQVCGDHQALKMGHKDTAVLAKSRELFKQGTKTLAPTAANFINEKLYADLFLREQSWVYRGGAGSCMGCTEITSIKMALNATTAKYGDNLAVIAATGCNSVFSSTYPYNIFGVPWTNSLFENAPSAALGVRMRLNQTGKKDTKLWVFGGDGAMFDIGFNALSRMAASGQDIKVLVLDTQVYSNTGGQASTSTFGGQTAKMSAHGKASKGKTERRKELAQIMMMHPDCYVAQISPTYYNHFLRCVVEALEYPGPAILIAYTACMPEHGIPDSAGFERSQAAVISRAFPLFVHDPRKGKLLKERLDLRGNPSMSEDWHKDPKTGEVMDFTWFAKAETRFAQHFDKEGKPSEQILQVQEERLDNWKRLRELAGFSK